MLLRPTKKFLARYRIPSTKLRRFTKRRAVRRLLRNKDQRSISLSMESLMVNSLSLRESSLIMLLKSKNRRHKLRNLMIKQMMTTLTMINTKMINSRTTTTEETLSVNNCTKIVPAKINKTDTMIDLAETIWMIRIKVKTMRTIRDLKEDLMVTIECLTKLPRDILVIKRGTMTKIKMRIMIMIDLSITSESNRTVKREINILRETKITRRTMKMIDKMTMVFSAELRNMSRTLTTLFLALTSKKIRSMIITLEDRETPLKDLTLVEESATLEIPRRTVTRREKSSLSVRSNNLVNKISKRMMTPILMIALMTNKRSIAISSSRKKSVLYRGKLNVLSKMKSLRTIKIQMMIKMKLAGVSIRSKTDLSQIAKRSLRKPKREISLPINLNQSPRVTTKVVMKTRLRKEKKQRSYLLREPRRSRRVLMISRRLPCKLNRLPPMSGPSNCMAVTLLLR